MARAPHSTTDGALDVGPPPTDPLERARVESTVAQALFGVSEPASVGRFRILARVGRGGMGVVYAAWDPSLERRVALKLVHTASDARRSELRLLAEARAAARLSHPNVVTVHEVGQAVERVFIAMEYVDGRTLDAAIGDGTDVPRVLELFRQAGRGLAAAHAVGLVHRDFKPANVLVAREISGEERARVADFGLARIERASIEDPSGLADTPLHLSVTGALLGTPAYMSPEQLSGQVADARSDQFSFCVALFEALHGAPPFGGTSAIARLEQIERGVAREATARTIPRRVAQALRRGLSADPGARFPDMAALLRELDPRISTRRRIALGVVGIVALAGAVAAARPDAGAAPCTDPGAPWRDSVGGVAEDAVAAIERAPIGSADTLATSARAGIDRDAASWADTRARVCEATRIHGTQSEELLDLRMNCLERRRREAHALLVRLTQADPGTLARSADLIESLESPARCATASARAGLLPPSDPELQEEHAALVAELAELRTDFVVSQWKRGHARASAIAERARAAGFDDVLAQAMSGLSAFEARLGDPKGARAMAEQALAAAVAAEWTELASEVAAGLVWTDGYLLGDHQAAERDGALALAWLGASGDDPDRRASILDNLGINAAKTKNYALAEARHREAMALASDEASRIRIAVNLGVALARQHRSEARAELEELMADTLARAEALYGPDNPTVAAILHNLAAAEMDAESCPAAIPRLERALAIKASNYGDDGLALASTHTALANCHGLLGAGLPALEELGRAIEIVERKLGPDHERLLAPLVSLATQRIEMGELDEAGTALERAQRINDAAFGPDDPSGYDLWGVRAALFAARGDRTGEREALHRALDRAVEGDPAAGDVADIHRRLLASLAAELEDAGISGP